MSFTIPQESPHSKLRHSGMTSPPHTITLSNTAVKAFSFFGPFLKVIFHYCLALFLFCSFFINVSHIYVPVVPPITTFLNTANLSQYTHIIRFPHTNKIFVLLHLLKLLVNIRHQVESIHIQMAPPVIQGPFSNSTLYYRACLDGWVVSCPNGESTERCLWAILHRYLTREGLYTHRPTQDGFTWKRIKETSMENTDRRK